MTTRLSRDAVPPHTAMTDAPLPFEFAPGATLIYQHTGALERLGELAKDVGASRVLLVTDRGIVDAGHASRACDILTADGLDAVTFDRVRENPTAGDVDTCAAVARDANIDVIIGLGGGSSLDTAKGANFILTNGGRMHDYRGYGKASKPMLPMIAVPTTAGTGSEVQSYALISDDDTHEKMACGDPKAMPRVALLDPELTLSMPRDVTAHTGLDAVVHAAETAVTKARGDVSQMFSQRAFELLHTALPMVLDDPSESAARGSMLVGAAYAGIAIENSMLGAAHSAANPLTAHFGVVHGEAVGLMLPHVMRYNRKDGQASAGYAELAIKAELCPPGTPRDEAVDALIARIDTLIADCKNPTTLSACGVPGDMIPTLAAEAASQWTAQFNPRPIDTDGFRALYEAAFE